ncbi:MAG: hypothetical protein HON94_04835 [Methylococcales bacterium]|jgi:hypothetical protein|nr:hypothetical protein [Methylococcales bacterium]
MNRQEFRYSLKKLGYSVEEFSCFIGKHPQTVYKYGGATSGIPKNVEIVVNMMMGGNISKLNSKGY